MKDMKQEEKDALIAAALADPDWHFSADNKDPDPYSAVRLPLCHSFTLAVTHSFALSRCVFVFLCAATLGGHRAERVVSLCRGATANSG